MAAPAEILNSELRNDDLPAEEPGSPGFQRHDTPVNAITVTGLAPQTILLAGRGTKIIHLSWPRYQKQADRDIPWETDGPRRVRD
ncbi:hypothetical protein Y032_0011g1401 [Ancylostoma ceylanicum]|uniref:Uncharacterized protein n=1 Tax=Ancylostoma ceylanicum TaxID=53326 RepID=A0A016VGD0_9BILA|nr:hypothetical protein Y032_0011g1401 [Ancylostoma ceylanicum]